MKKITKKEEIKIINKLADLENRALCRYANKNDMDFLDWLEEKEQREYLKLYKKLNGDCFYCYENKCDC